MNIKLEKTLTLLFISLFINNVNAETSESAACNKALEKGDVVSALVQADTALKNNKNDRDALVCKGRALIYKGEANAAIDVFKLAESVSKNAFDKTIASLLTGHAYKELKQIEQAIASYEQTIKYAQAANSQAFQRVGYNAIGDAYFETKQYSLALSAYSTGSTLAANDNERGESYERVALTHHTINQHEQALEFQLKAYLMHEKVGTLDQFAHSSIELGRYYLMVKNYVRAENTLNKIIKFAKEQGGAYFEAKGSCVLARVKNATGDNDATKSLINYARNIAIKSNDKAFAEEIELEVKDMI